MSATPGEVNNSGPVAAQQDAILSPSLLWLKRFQRSGQSAFSFDLEAFGRTPLFLCHSR
jgi:hypothetical protein